MQNKLKGRGIANLIIISLCILCLVVNVALGGGNRFWLFLTGGGQLNDYGAASFQTVFRQGEWWRLLTCGYLHLGVIHLAANLLALWYIGDVMEHRLGKIKFLFVYHFAMMISTALWIVIFRNSTMVGASTGIFSLIGIYFIWMKMPKGRARNYLIGYAIGANVIWYKSTIIHLLAFWLEWGLELC